MDDFRIILVGEALKSYQSCSLEFAKRLNICFEHLEINPFWGPHIKLLKTHKGKRYYRYRIGDCRVLYEIDQTHKKIGIFRIAPRSEAYRNL